MRSILLKLQSNTLKKRGVRPQFQRERLIFIEAVGDHVGMADSIEKARGNPTRKRLTTASQYGQSRPQGVAGGAVGIVRQSVEEQVGQAMARQMLRWRQSASEDETDGINPAHGSFFAQIILHAGTIRQQPQPAAIKRAQ